MKTRITEIQMSIRSTGEDTRSARLGVGKGARGFIIGSQEPNKA